MSKRIFTKDQIDDLLKNPNVIKCSEKTISYCKEFKVSAVAQHRGECMTCNEIFIKAGFNIVAIGKKTPEKCLERWTKIYQNKGPEGLMAENRGRLGGRPKTKNLTDVDKINRLETQVAYLKAENDFLAKLRAKRAEQYSSRSRNTNLLKICS